MLKNLKRKLALFNTVVSGLILTIVVVVVAAVSEQSESKKNENLFGNQMIVLYQKLLYDSRIEHSWLNQMELNNRFIIHIEENNIPLLYEGVYSSKTDRSVLTERVKKAAKKEHVDTTVRPMSSSFLQSSLIPVSGTKGDSYVGMVMVFKSDTSYFSITLLEDITDARNTLMFQRLLFLLADLAGIICLFLVNLRIMNRALKPVEENERKQQSFIAAASHELRSPLAVIQSSAEAVETSDPEAKRFLFTIGRECKRMSRLVQDLLLLAAAKSDTWTVQKTRVDMDTLLLDLYECYAPLCRERQRLLKLELPEDALPNVNGDSERLTHILSILLDNAVSYSPKGSEILLKAYMNKQQLVCAVIDHGSGIPHEEQEQIFECFYRSDRSRKDKEHFGLGLNVALELTKLHGGSLKVQDTPGGGSTFIVELPV